MPQELIYTSATSGLKPGSKGFCTVAATNGIPPRTVTLLESLSGYRHVHPPSEIPHPGNPIAWSHLLTPTGESLISRVADAGLDYSGRSNKIAHHVLLAQSERASFGPAAMMRAGHNLTTSWTTPPKWIGTRRLDAGTHAAIPSATWQSVMGDAGWAGVLAQAAVDPGMPECYVVFEAGQDLLALFDEALSMLSPEQRWKVTFNTFFARLPPGMSCQWRGILKGSSEHRCVPPHDRVVRIDLTSRARTESTGPLIDLARTGQRKPPSSTGVSPRSRDQIVHNPTALPEIVNPTRLPPAPDLSELPYPLAPDERPPILEANATTRRPSPVRAWLIMAFCFLLPTWSGLAYIVWKKTQSVSNDHGVSVTSPTEFPSESITVTTNDFETASVDTHDSKSLPNEPTEEVSDLFSAMSPIADSETVGTGPPQGQQVLKEPPVEMPTLSEDTSVSDSIATDEPEGTEPDLKKMRLRYLLEPSLWRQFEKQQQEWKGDQSVYRSSVDIDVPTRVAAATIDANGMITRDGKLNFDTRSHALVFGQPSGSGLVPSTKVVLFEPDAVILQPNYAKRIGNRLLIAESTDHWTLLTIGGTLTPKRGMDSPLQVDLIWKDDDTASKTVDLGEINSSVLSSSSVRLNPSAESDWNIVWLANSMRFTKSLSQTKTVNKPPIDVVVNIDLVKNTPPRIRINARLETNVGPATQEQRIDSVRTVETIRKARSELDSVSLEVDIASELQFGKQRFLVVLSQFAIGFK